MKPGEIDLFNPDVFVDGVPFETFRRLRAEAPVYWHEAPFTTGRPGYWAITRQKEIIPISRDPGTFSSERLGTQLLDWHEDDLTAIRLMMLNMDPPQHVKFRNLVKGGFLPRMTAALEPRIRSRVRDILDAIALRGECDFVGDIAARMPLEVIAEMLGIPDEDREKVFVWTNRLIGFDDPEFKHENSMQDTRDAGAEMWMYALALAESREGQVSDDFVSVLLRAEVEGEKLTQMEFCSFFLLLAVAGNETTRNATSGGMLALLQHPDERARLQANPALLPGAIEEMLRWTSPVVYMARTATRDVELCGQQILAGDRMALYYPSANRDEAVFKDPERFDITRSPNDHLAFGIGQHMCLGASLARLELRVLFEELLRRFPDMELAAPVRRLRSNFINGIKEMRMSFTPERARIAAAG